MPQSPEMLNPPEYELPPTEMPATMDHANPRNMAQNISRLRAADNMRRESNILVDAARIAREHDCPSLDNACMLLARTLANSSAALRKRAEDVKVKDNLV
jgi:hypothetical protein